MSKQTSPVRGIVPLALVHGAFATLGVVGAMLGALVPALRLVSGLDFRSALIAQWLTLVVCGLLSIPLVAGLRQIGLGGMIALGLASMAAGCTGLALMIGVLPYAAVLVALAVIALGMAALQVAGNPLAMALGDPARAPARMALVQAFNALGALAGVNLAAWLMLRHHDTAGGISAAYALDAVVALAMLVAFAAGRRWMRTPVDEALVAWSMVLRAPAAWLGAGTIALYCGVEGAVGGVVVNLLHDPGVWGVSLPRAGVWFANGFFGGTLVGRFAGAWVLRRLSAPRALLAVALAAAALCATVAFGHGAIAGWAALAIGLCNAIMFPTIFAITLARFPGDQAAASALLCSAIAGGALVSVAMGEGADRLGLSAAFVIPLAAYTLVALFALATPRTIRE